MGRLPRIGPPLALCTVLLAACGGQAQSAPTTPTTPTATTPRSPAPPSPTEPKHTTHPRVIGTIATDLAVPWGIAFLPDGSALVTERDTGRVLQLTRSRPHWKVRVAATLDEHSIPGGETGLLGIAVSPTFRHDHRVFCYLSTDHDNRIVRFTFSAGALHDATPILTGIPVGTYHDGGRLAFGPDGALYASTGETGDRALAQDPHSLAGKILRITQNGDPAPGNPTAGSPVWTLGHRNVQGLAFTPDRRMWASEFGDHTWDELNLIVRGKNYGWPAVEGRSADKRFVNPLAQWHTDQASPSGLAYADGSLWLGALHGARLWQVPVHGSEVGRSQSWFVGDFGRLRTVVRAPDGDLWVTTSNRDGRGQPEKGDDRILVVRP